MIKEEMKQACIAAIDGALVSRGKNRGMLKANCPASGTDAAAAWQAMMLHANPYKASVWRIALFSERQRAIYRNIEEALSTVDLRALDRDRVALELMGAW